MLIEPRFDFHRIIFLQERSMGQEKNTDYKKGRKKPYQISLPPRHGRGNGENEQRLQWLYGMS